MNYDIKIYGEDVDDGSIEFDRLNYLTKSAKEIAIKALMLKLRGYSDVVPDKYLKKALDLKLQSICGSIDGGTQMTIDCNQFKDTIKGVQYDLFKPTERVLNMTPMYLIIEAFQKALYSETDNVDLDKPLLKSLSNFKKNFVSSNQVFYLSNRGSIPELRLSKNDFEKIAQLEDKFPLPQKTIVSGKLDELKISKGRLGLQTSDGLITLIAKDDEVISGLLDFMGKEVTITGTSHFKPNGQLSFIEILSFNTPNGKDIYFSRKSTTMTAKQQVLFQIKNGKKSNPLENIFGLLKDEINDEQFHEIIKSTHR